jgi:hypothetical protein
VSANITFSADVANKDDVSEVSSVKEWPVVLPMIRTLKDIEPGEELVGLYGTEWWTQHFLSRLFVAAEDDQMKHVRWIESIFTEGMGKKGSPFPLLKLCRSRKAPGTLDLADPATRAVASSSGIVAASIRKSCQDHTMLRDTLAQVFGCSVRDDDSGGAVYPAIAPLTQQPIKKLRGPLIECLLREKELLGPASTTPSKSATVANDEDVNGGVSL